MVLLISKFGSPIVVCGSSVCLRALTSGEVLVKPGIYNTHSSHVDLRASRFSYKSCNSGFEPALIYPAFDHLAPSETMRDSVLFLVLAGVFQSLTTLAQTSLTAEDCTVQCTSYKYAVQAVHQQYSPNVYTPGTSLSITTISGMCDIFSDYTSNCALCIQRGLEQNEDGELNIPLLYSWDYTCQTYRQEGGGEAVQCWHSLPNSISGCTTEGVAISGTPAEAGGNSDSSSPGADPTPCKFLGCKD